MLISLRSKCDQASIKSIFTLALTVSFVHCSFDSVSSKGVSFLVGAKKTTTSFLPLIISTYLVVSSPPTLSKRSRTKFPPPPPKKSDGSRSHFFLKRSKEAKKERQKRVCAGVTNCMGGRIRERNRQSPFMSGRAAQTS